MSMDDEWKKVYDARARKDIPEYLKSYWTKEGYEELLVTTLRLVDELSDCKTILDDGCGPGRYCHELTSKGFEVTGIDYSEEMIAAAKEQYPDEAFLVGNGYALPFSDKSFDLVLSIGALQCVSDHDRFLREMIRTAKKYIIVSTLYEKEKKDLHDELVRKLVEDPWPTREYHPDHLLEILEKEGFSCTVITHNGKRLIKDGFFIVGKRR